MAATLSMGDIATLAGVRRQAVTNWRRRPTGVPFPDPVARFGGVERFDRDTVVEWLEQTGRGKNPEARVDAPAIAVPEGVTIGAAIAAFVVRSSIAEDLGPLAVADRLAIARRRDPHDAFVLSEFAEVANNDAVLSYVDELLAASFGPADALDRLYTSSASLGGRGIADELIEVLRFVAAGCRDVLGSDGVAVDLRLDPRARRVAEGFSFAGPGNSRLVRQHLAAEGLDVDGDHSPLLRVVSVLGVEDAEALRLVADLSVDLAADQIAVVVGAASALCDRQVGELYMSRRETIEEGARGYGGALTAAFRLPRGLWTHAYRQNVGLWVLRGASTQNTTVIGDASAVIINPEELANDIVAALKGTDTRSYMYGRRVPYSSVWTRDAVVDLGVGPIRVPSSQDARARRDRVDAATLVTREPLDGFDLPIGPIGRSSTAATRVLGELTDRGAIALLRGARIRPEHLDPTASGRVVSADPAAGEMRIDPFVAADHYNSARRTDPGDVIFIDHPVRRAVVDSEGNALVLTPSRILRLRPEAGIGAYTLAAMINSSADPGDWRTWSIPALPPDQIAHIEVALLAAAQHLAELRRREFAVTDLVLNLVDGVAEGSIAIVYEPTTKEEG